MSMSIGTGRTTPWRTESLKHDREKQEKIDQENFEHNADVLAQSIAQSIAKELFERLKERETTSCLMHTDEKHPVHRKYHFFNVNTQEMSWIKNYAKEAADLPPFKQMLDCLNDEDIDVDYIEDKFTQVCDLTKTYVEQTIEQKIKLTYDNNLEYIIIVARTPHYPKFPKVHPNTILDCLLWIKPAHIQSKKARIFDVYGMLEEEKK